MRHYSAVAELLLCLCLEVSSGFVWSMFHGTLLQCIAWSAMFDNNDDVVQLLVLVCQLHWSLVSQLHCSSSSSLPLSSSLSSSFGGDDGSHRQKTFTTCTTYRTTKDLCFQRTPLDQFHSTSSANMSTSWRKTPTYNIPTNSRSAPLSYLLYSYFYKIVKMVL